MDANTPVLQCPDSFSQEPGIIAFLFVLICIAVIIITVFAFIKQRIHLAPNCCHGHPGIPVPIDFLITPRHRWIYVAILGIMAVTLFDYLLRLNIHVDNLYLRFFVSLIILPLVVIIMMGLLFAPLFLCIDAPLRFVGHVIGLIYSLLWYAFILASHIGHYVRLTIPDCNIFGQHIAVDIFRDLPYLAVNGIIVLWYLYQVIVGTWRFIQKKDDKSGSYITTKFIHRNRRFSNTCHNYQISRVKVLLRNNKRQIEIRDIQRRSKRLMHKIWNYFIPFDKNFRLPLPFLGAFSAVLMILYQWMFLLGSFGLWLVKVLYLFIKHNNILSTQSRHPDTIINNSIQAGFNTGLPVIVTVSPVLAFITCLLLLLHMIGSVSKTMKKAAQEGFSEKLPGVLKRVASSWKYIGLQIGFCIVAWFAYYLIYLMVGITIGIIIILGIIPITRNWIINIIIGILIPLIWAKAVFYSQFLICKFFFLSDKEGKFICITNKNIFNCCAFLLFFYNGFAGFVSAVVRVSLSAGIGLVLLFRLDQNVLTKTFSFLDFGHKAFLGFFYLDYAYNNAVMHVFIKIMKESVCKDQSVPKIQKCLIKQKNDGSLVKNASRYPNGSYSQRRIHNRWLVAYTLVRNPSLQCLTGSNLQSEKARKSEKLDDLCSKSSLETV